MVVSPGRAARILAALAAVMFCALFTAGRAQAVPLCAGSDPPPECFTPYKDTKTWNVTVNVPLAGGHVTSSDGRIDCTATCTTPVTVERWCTQADGCPAFDWPTLVLSATGGRPGYSPTWGTCSTGTTCSIVVDDHKSVTLGWRDVTPPVVTFHAPQKGGPSTVLSATAADNSNSVQQMYWSVDGVARTPVSGGSLSLALGQVIAQLSEGDHTFTALAEDGSNLVASATRTITIDKSVHVTLGGVPAYTNAATVPVTFTPDDDVAVALCDLNDTGLRACSSPYSPIDGSSRDGAYTYSVHVTDDVGNTATETRSFVLDRTLPAAAFTGGPGDGAVVTGTAATLTFTASDANLDAVTCSVDGGAPAPCDSTLALSNLAAGDHVVTVRAADKAGNVRDITRRFTTKAPGPGNPGPGDPATTTPKIAVKAKVKKGVTTIKAFALKGLPKGSTVTITCKGKGCAKKKLVLKRTAGGALTIKALAGRKLGAGAKLTVKVAAKGAAPFKRTVTVRAGKAPLVR